MNEKKTSRGSLFVLLPAFIVVSMLSGLARAETPLTGAWLLTDVKGADGKVDSEPHRGLLIFTGDHYSIMYARGQKPRALMDEDHPSDAQQLEAYNSITANTGRYDVEGKTYTTRAYVAKSPNYMDGWPENVQTYEFSIDGDTLEVTAMSGPSKGETRTYRKVEGSPHPWK